MDFATIQQYYNAGLYNNDAIKIFVLAGYLTAEQYEEITGEAYAA